MDLTLPVALPSARQLPWRALAGALVCGVLLLGGWLWLRDSSLVSASDVRISGVRGAQSGQIDQLLRATAKRMTTMDFSASALRAALASFPVVKEVHVSTSFPHAVRIDVVERPAVAVLLAAGQRTALAADGTALGEQLVSSALPTLSGSFLPVPGQRVSDPVERGAAALLGATPSQLVRFAERVFSGAEGLTVQMRNGLLVYFGDASRPRAKWLSLARVLADPGSAGARYIDVRVPERPAAGLSGAQGSTAGASGLGTSLSANASASPTAALAERLEQATGAGSSAASAGERVGESGTTAGESSNQSASQGAASATSEAAREAPSGAGAEGEAPPHVTATAERATGGATPSVEGAGKG